MPKFRITDNTTGRSVVVSGDSAPTDAEKAEIFSKLPAAPSVAQPVAAQATPVETPLQKILGQAGQVVKTTQDPLFVDKALGNTLGNFFPAHAQEARTFGTGLGLIANQDLLQQTQKQSAAQSQKFIQMAKTETDPARKAQLLAASRAVDQAGGNAIDTTVGGAEQAMGVQGLDQKSFSTGSPQEIAQNVRLPAAAALEQFSSLAPGLKWGKSADAAGKLINNPGIPSALARILGNTVTGGVRAGAEGLARGLANPQTSDEQIVNQGVSSAKLGGLISGASSTVGEVVGGIKNFFIPKDATKQVWKSAFTVPSQVQDNINVDKTAEKMTRYGVAGSIPDISAKTESVRQPLLNFRDRVIESIDQPIDVVGAQDAAKDVLNTKGVQDLSGNQTKQVLQTIRNITGGGGEEFGKASASQAFNAVTQLEDLGFEKLDKSKDAFGQVVNNQKYAEAQAYLEAAKHIKSQIDAITVANPEAVKNALTPEIQAQLNDFSPELLKDAQKADTLGKVRSLMAPFHDIHEMIRTTQRAQNTAFQQAVSRGVPPGGLNFLNPATYINPIIQTPQFKTGIGVAGAAGVSSQASNATQPLIDLLTRLGIPLAVSKATQQQGQNVTRK